MFQTFPSNLDADSGIDMPYFISEITSAWRAYSDSDSLIDAKHSFDVAFEKHNVDSRTKLNAPMIATLYLSDTLDYCAGIKYLW